MLWGFIFMFLIGFAFGFILAAIVWAVRRGSRGIKHSFSKYSMPELDIDEDILSKGRKDHSQDEFREG